MAVFCEFLRLYDESDNSIGADDYDSRLAIPHQGDDQREQWRESAQTEKSARIAQDEQEELDRFGSLESEGGSVVPMEDEAKKFFALQTFSDASRSIRAD